MFKLIALTAVVLCASPVFACNLQEAKIEERPMGSVILVCVQGEYKTPSGDDWHQLFRLNLNNSEFKKQFQAATGRDMEEFMESIAGVGDPVLVYATDTKPKTLEALKYLAKSYSAANGNPARSEPAGDPAAAGT